MHIFDHRSNGRVQTQRNRLLINRLQLYRLLKQRVGEVAADWFFEGLHYAPVKVLTRPKTFIVAECTPSLD